MGLLTSVTSLTSTAKNGGTFLADTGKNALKWVGIDISNDTVKDENIQTEDSSGATKLDMRGLQTVGRNISQNRAFDMDLGDFHWKESFLAESNQNFKPQINKLIIHEFQPDEVTVLGQLYLTLSKLANAGSGGSTEQKIKNALEKALKPLGTSLLVKTAKAKGSILSEFGKFMKNALIKQYSQNPELLHNKDLQTSTLTDGFQATMRLFPFGNFLYSYTIPLLNENGLSDNFTLFDDNGSGWGKTTKLFDDPVKDTKNNIMNILATPTQTAGIKDPRRSVTTTFYLINSTSEYTVRNYIFLHVLTAGAYQMQLPLGELQPPNVYHVEIPGKRELVWAQMSISVTEIGKYKKDEYSQLKIKQRLDQFIIEKKQQKINTVTGLLFPEAWKLTITFTDFTPNTFNSYEHYLKYGSCLASLQKHASSFTWESMQNDMKKIQDNLKSNNQE